MCAGWERWGEGGVGVCWIEGVSGSDGFSPVRIPELEGRTACGAPSDPRQPSLKGAFGNSLVKVCLMASKNLKRPTAMPATGRKKLLHPL